MVSIVIPIYNCEKYILKTLKSVACQTYQDYEVILVNDKSSDRSCDVINDFILGFDTFKLIHLEKNSGAAVAINTGIENASGDYIAFLDSDDAWHTEKLEKQIEFMQNNEYAFTYTAYEKLDENGNNLDEIVAAPKKINYKMMLKANFVGCSTVIYNRKVLGNITFPLLRKRQDYALWLKILKQIKFGYGFDHVLTSYTVRSDSISSNKVTLIKYNWRLFREIENFGLVKSAYYIVNNIIYKLFIKK